MFLVKIFEYLPVPLLLIIKSWLFKLHNLLQVLNFDSWASTDSLFEIRERQVSDYIQFSFQHFIHAFFDCFDLWIVLGEVRIDGFFKFRVVGTNFITSILTLEKVISFFINFEHVFNEKFVAKNLLPN